MPCMRRYLSSCHGQTQAFLQHYGEKFGGGSGRSNSCGCMSIRTGFEDFEEKENIRRERPRSLTQVI